MNNGRVDLKSPNTSKLFEMYDKIPTNEIVSFRNATQNLWESSVLSQTFFSKENIQILQNGIRSGIYKKSNSQYVIAIQDNDSLKTVMRSVFLQHSANQPNNIKNQIIELNKIVLDYCIQQVYSEVQGYIKYLDDVSSLVVPIAHPVMSSQNDKQLELKPWF